MNREIVPLLFVGAAGLAHAWFAIRFGRLAVATREPLFRCGHAGLALVGGTLAVAALLAVLSRSAALARRDSDVRPVKKRLGLCAVYAGLGLGGAIVADAFLVTASAQTSWVAGATQLVSSGVITAIAVVLCVLALAEQRMAALAARGEASPSPVKKAAIDMALAVGLALVGLLDYGSWRLGFGPRPVNPAFYGFLTVAVGIGFVGLALALIVRVLDGARFRGQPAPRVDAAPPPVEVGRPRSSRKLAAGFAVAILAAATGVVVIVTRTTPPPELPAEAEER